MRADGQTDGRTNSLILFHSKRAFYGYLMSGNNKTYLGLHEKCPTFFPDFTHVWIFSTDFLKSPSY